MYCICECWAEWDIRCWPKGSLMCPLFPYLVRSSIGLNHWISSTGTRIVVHCMLDTHTIHTVYLSVTASRYVPYVYTSVEKHVSNHSRLLVDFERMPTQDYSFAHNSVGVHFMQWSQGKQLVCVCKKTETHETRCFKPKNEVSTCVLAFWVWSVRHVHVFSVCADSIEW